MATEYATLMVLEVDLECSRCFLKVKKVLGSLPQIGDQVFYWNKNEVKISVLCCDPEKVRQKICSKAGKAIKNVHLKPKATVNAKTPAEKPKEAQPLKEVKKPLASEKPKEIQHLKEVKKLQANVKPKELEKKVRFVEQNKPKTDEKSTKPTKVDPSKSSESAPKPTINPVSELVKMAAPVNGYPLQVYQPGVTYCGQCHAGGPCHHVYNSPAPSANGPFEYGYEYGYGGSRAANVSRLDYFSEENSSGCLIM